MYKNQLINKNNIITAQAIKINHYEYEYKSTKLVNRSEYHSKRFVALVDRPLFATMCN